MQIIEAHDIPLSQYPYLEYYVLDQYEALTDIQDESTDGKGVIPDIDDIVVFAVLYVNDILRENEMVDAWNYSDVPHKHGFDDYWDFREAVLADEIEELISENLLDEYEVRDDVIDYLMRHQMVFRNGDQFFNLPVVGVW